MRTRFERPGSIDEATRLLAAARGRCSPAAPTCTPRTSAGRWRAPLLDVTAIAGAARHPARRRRGWSIGATTTWSDVVRAELPPLFDALKAAAREVGGVQIQNTGTVAGNLCNASPAADGTPVLMALGASRVLRSERGEREVPVEQFVLGNRRTVRAADELLVALRIPARWRGRALGVHQARRPALPDDLDDAWSRSRSTSTPPARSPTPASRSAAARRWRGGCRARGAPRRRARRQRPRRAGRARRPCAADADRRPARQRRVPPRRDDDPAAPRPARLAAS